MNPNEATRELAWHISNLWIMYALLIPTVGGLAYGVWRRLRYWLVGQPEIRWNRPLERLKRVLDHALGQGRVSRRRVFGKVHAGLVWAMIVLFGGTFVAMLEMDLHLHIMHGWFYLIYQSLILDIAGLLTILAVVGFYVRKAIVGPTGATKRDRPPGWEMPDWVLPSLIAFLCLQGFVLEAMRIAGTNDPWAAWSPVANAMAPLFRGWSVDQIVAVYPWLWWFHYITTSAFIVALPYSNLFHIVTSPLTIFASNIDAPRTEIPYIDFEKTEQFGASRIQDFSWKDLADLDACTACGRCDDACPATNTNKMLRPRTIILNLRDYMRYEAGPAILAAKATNGGAAKPNGSTPGSSGATGSTGGSSGGPGTSSSGSANGPAGGANGSSNGGNAFSNRFAVLQSNKAAGVGGAPYASLDAPLEPKTILGDVVPEQMLWECTTCRACQEACPVYIEHVPKIVDMRRALVLMESRFPNDLTGIFRNLETSANPWGFPNGTRGDWAKDIGLPIFEGPIPAEYEYLFWVGCYGSFDSRNKKVSVALAQVMQRAGVKVGILGRREKCTGDPARRAGNEFVYQMLAQENVDTLNAIGVKKIVTACPHCFNTIKNEYRDLGGNYEVIHHSELIADLIQTGRLELVNEVKKTVTYHDPCYLGRYNKVFDPPRYILEKIQGVELIEMARSREKSFCCGAGGARGFMEEAPEKRVNENRVAEAQATGAATLAVACPFCVNMVQDALRSRGSQMADEDVAELAEQASRPPAASVDPPSPPADPAPTS